MQLNQDVNSERPRMLAATNLAQEVMLLNLKRAPLIVQRRASYGRAEVAFATGEAGIAGAMTLSLLKADCGSGELARIQSQPQFLIAAGRMPTVPALRLRAESGRSALPEPAIGFHRSTGPSQL